MTYMMLGVGLFCIAISVLLKRGSEILRMLGLTSDAKESFRVALVVAMVGLVLVCYAYPKTTYPYKTANELTL